MSISTPCSYDITWTDMGNGASIPSILFEKNGVEFECFFEGTLGNYSVALFSNTMDQDENPFTMAWDDEGRQQAYDSIGERFVNTVDLFFLDISLTR